MTTARRPHPILGAELLASIVYPRARQRLGCWLRGHDWIPVHVPRALLHDEEYCRNCWRRRRGV